MGIMRDLDHLRIVKKNTITHEEIKLSLAKSIFMRIF